MAPGEVDSFAWAICPPGFLENTGPAPAYAWYRMPMYKPSFLPLMYPPFAEANKSLVLDPETGLCLEGDRVYSLNRLNGSALPTKEPILLRGAAIQSAL